MGCETCRYYDDMLKLQTKGYVIVDMPEIHPCKVCIWFKEKKTNQYTKK